jgi:hypothetical protein
MFLRFLAVISALFRVFPVYTLQGIDGQYAHVFLTKPSLWGAPAIGGTTYNPLEGAGSLFFPVDGHFNPIVWPFVLLTDPVNQVWVSYVVAALLVFVSTLLVCVALGFPWPIAEASAWFTVLLLMCVPGISTVTPHFLQSVVTVNLLLAVVAVVGRRRSLTTLLGIGAFIALSGYLVMIDPGYAVVSAPTLAALVTAIIVSSATRRERGLKILAVGLALCTHAALQTPQNLYALFSYTARSLVSREIIHQPQVAGTAGLPFMPGAEVFTVLFVLGALCTLVDAVPGLPANAKSLATATGGLFAALTLAGAVYRYTDILWLAPNPRFFFMAFYPPVAIFCVVAVLAVPRLVSRTGELIGGPGERRVVMILTAALGYVIARMVWEPASRPALGLLMLSIGAAAILDRYGRRRGASRAVMTLFCISLALLPALPLLPYTLGLRDRETNDDRRFVRRIWLDKWFALGLETNPIRDFLSARLAIRPGSTFHGYADDFYRSGRPVDHIGLELVANWHANWGDYGNGLRVFNWHFADIPTLSSYNAYISPPYYVLFSRSFNDPSEFQAVNYLGITRPRLSLLAMMGLRFLVTNGPLEDGFTRLVLSWERFRIYELPEPNLGTYSPSTVRTVGDAGTVIRTIESAEFDPRTTALVMSPVTGTEHVQAATRSELRYIKGGFTVSATSSGASLLLLPIQFSHCLVVHARSGDRAPRAVRTNLALLGLRFVHDLDVVIRWDFRYFGRNRCRVQDIADFERHRMDDVIVDREMPSYTHPGARLPVAHLFRSRTPAAR